MCPSWNVTTGIAIIWWYQFVTKTSPLSIEREYRWTTTLFPCPPLLPICMGCLVSTLIYGCAGLSTVVSCVKCAHPTCSGFLWWQGKATTDILGTHKRRPSAHSVCPSNFLLKSNFLQTLWALPVGDLEALCPPGMQEFLCPPWGMTGKSHKVPCGNGTPLLETALCGETAGNRFL